MLSAVVVGIVPICGNNNEVCTLRKQKARGGRQRGGREDGQQKAVGKAGRRADEDGSKLYADYKILLEFYN